MYKLTISKSFLMKMSALAASALIMAACTATGTTATGAATSSSQAAATSTTEPAATTEATATTEGTATTEAPATTEAMTSTESMSGTTGSATETPAAGTSSSSGMTSTEQMSSTQGMSQTGSVNAGPVTVNAVDNADYGKILVDAKGMTLYVFDKDTAGSGKSVCNGGCLVKWPALLAADENTQVTAGEGVTGQFSTVTRDDGSYQVAVNGLPLYYYQPDTKPGDTTGQGVGEVWWVVGPDGNKITKK